MYSGAGSDAHWVASLTKASATSVRVAAERGISDIVWMGDFNLEPTEIRGVKDRRARCRNDGNGKTDLTQCVGQGSLRHQRVASTQHGRLQAHFP